MNRRTIIISLIICAAIVVLAAAFASSHPDGLERVAEKMGFAGSAAEKNIVNEGVLSGVIAGLSGVLAVFLAASFFGRVINGRKRRGERVEQTLDRP